VDLRTLHGAAVLVVGDVMLDEYLWGDVSRVSPEAPVPIVEIGRRTVAPGGAGNAAAGVAALGGRVHLISVVGDDPTAARLREALADHRVDGVDLAVAPGRVTTIKTRLIARGQHVVRMDAEDRAPIGPAAEADLLSRVQAVTGCIDAVILSDYAKGVVSTALARGVIDHARSAGKPVIADPAGRDYRKYQGASMITPSVDDVEAAVGRRMRTDADLLRAGVELARLLPETDVLVTRGSQGMWLMSQTAVALDIPARARSVYDITGAGDTVVATLAVALGRGVDRPAAVGLANVAAGIVVGKAGTASVSLDEIALEAAASSAPLDRGERCQNQPMSGNEEFSRVNSHRSTTSPRSSPNHR
jgi:D-beta-D-heptose 7-phosphate kinase/D-beta-D-heptose 1-phosphate adenosyltransferase